MLLGNEPLLGRASFFFSLYFVFFRGAVFSIVSLVFVVCVLSVTCPPRGQDSDTTAAVDEVRNTWLTKTLE